jgi:hypothetical protein
VERGYENVPTLSASASALALCGVWCRLWFDTTYIVGVQEALDRLL